MNTEEKNYTEANKDMEIFFFNALEDDFINATLDYELGDTARYNYDNNPAELKILNHNGVIRYFLLQYQECMQYTYFSDAELCSQPLSFVDVDKNEYGELFFTDKLEIYNEEDIVRKEGFLVLVSIISLEDVLSIFPTIGRFVGDDEVWEDFLTRV